MYAIMGITGQVGGAAARTLLANGQSVRAIVRDPSKAARWAAVGAEVAVADFRDPAALQSAFAGVDGVFVMNPPNFAPVGSVALQAEDFVVIAFGSHRGHGGRKSEVRGRRSEVSGLVI